MARAGSDKWTIAIARSEAEFVCTAGESFFTARITARHSAIKIDRRNGGCGAWRYQHQKMARPRISEADEAAGIARAYRLLSRSNLAVGPLPLPTNGALA